MGLTLTPMPCPYYDMIAVNGLLVLSQSQRRRSLISFQYKV